MALPASLHKFKAFLCQWNAASWITCLVITILLRTIPGKINPSCRPIDLWDSTINHAHVSAEMIPNPKALVPIVILPVFVVYMPVIYLFSATTRPAHREFATWALAHWTSWCISDVIVDSFKVFAGRFRPDFIDRLRIEGLVVGNNPPQWVNGTAIDLCQEKYITNPILREGRLSFPSGHSSMSWASMMVLILFLFTKLRPFHHRSFARLCVVLSPSILAFVVMVSRTLDNWHNFSDVLTGGLLGGFGGIVAVFLFFDYVAVHGILVPKKPAACGDADGDAMLAEEGRSLSGLSGADNERMKEVGFEGVALVNGGAYEQTTDDCEHISNRTRAHAYPGLLTKCCEKTE